MTKRLLLIVLWFGFAAMAGAQVPKVAQAWARPTVPGQSAGGGYLRIDNRGGAPDRLIGARSDAAASVELHRMSMDGNVMRMRRVDAIDVPAGATVELKPGGLHLMLMDLKAPLQAGGTIDLVLTFEKAGELRVPMTVGRREHGHGHDHGHGHGHAHEHGAK